MSTNIVVNNAIQTEKAAQTGVPRWQTILFWGTIVALVGVAIAMRLYQLNLPFDYDGYDEGVYWQSLRSMSSGYALYQQVFYSQPPFFLLSTYPFYVLFGSTIWSARLGVALVSLLGLPGAYLIGKSLGGRIGAIAALFLLIINPLYLAQSQILEAEVSSAAFSLLAVGAAYMWWTQPESVKGLWYAILSGVTLSLGILCKLLSVTSVVPITLLLLVRLWQIWQKHEGTSRRWRLPRPWRPIIALVVASVVTMLLLLLPFLGAYTSFWRDVVTFHTDAKTVLFNNQVQNKALILNYFTSSWPFGIAALYGVCFALIRRDWRVLPLIAWFLVTLYILWEQVPLFPRHMIALVPILIAMAVLGFGEMPNLKEVVSTTNLMKLIAPLAILLTLFVAGMSVLPDEQHYQTLSKIGNSPSTQLQLRIANDLHNSITPNQFVVTDGQFVAGLANRNTSPALVDTSMVRIVSGYLTLSQLENQASQPEVHAILFYSSRLSIQAVAGFHAWVAQHFQLKATYGSGIELWVR